MKCWIIFTMGIFILAFSIPLWTGNASAYGFHTGVIYSQIDDNSQLGDPIVANYGGSTEYGYDAPAMDTHPQFYAGVEAHTMGGWYMVWRLLVSVSGTDPNGVALSGDRFTGLTALHSPESGSYQYVLDVVYQTLVNVVPYGIGSDIEYAFSTQPTGYDGSHAWADWYSWLGGPYESGLRFGFQLAVDPTLPGTYTINIAYLAGIWESDAGGNPVPVDGVTISQGLDYCYQYCTYNVNILTSERWRGAPPPCQPAGLLDVYRDNVKIGTSDTSGHYVDHPQSGTTHTYYAKDGQYGSNSQTVSGPASFELCVVTPF